ncbi:MAG: hypothetical protein ACOC9T_01485 [Myxococcota bacterium]
MVGSTEITARGAWVVIACMTWSITSGCDHDCPAGTHEEDQRCVCNQPHFRDMDGDGFGDPDTPADEILCDRRPGFVANADDCDDGCADCNPSAEEEACDGRDNDCDGQADDGFECVQGEELTCTTACGTIGTGTCSSSCTLPGTSDCTPPPDVCNYVDDDCDGVADEGLWKPSAPVALGSEDAQQVAIVGTDDGFIAFARESKQITGQLLDPTGLPIGNLVDATRSPSATQFADVAAASDGSRVLLSWIELGGKTVALVLDDQLAALGVPQEMESDAFDLLHRTHVALQGDQGLVVSDRLGTMDFHPSMRSVGISIDTGDAVEEGRDERQRARPVATTNASGPGLPWRVLSTDMTLRKAASDGALDDPDPLETDMTAMGLASDGSDTLAVAGWSPSAEQTLLRLYDQDSLEPRSDWAEVSEAHFGALALAHAGGRWLVLSARDDGSAEGTPLELRIFDADGALAEGTDAEPILLPCDGSVCRADFEGVDIAVREDRVMLAASRADDTPLGWFFGCDASHQ